jgi:hypothetical protein
MELFTINLFLLFYWNNDTGDAMCSGIHLLHTTVICYVGICLIYMCDR